MPCIYRYQKKAAKLTQDFTAGANEVWKNIDPMLKKLQITFGMISFSYLFVGCTRDTFSDENSPGFWNRKKRIWKVNILSILSCQASLFSFLSF